MTLKLRKLSTFLPPYIFFLKAPRNSEILGFLERIYSIKNALSDFSISKFFNKSFARKTRDDVGGL